MRRLAFRIATWFLLSLVAICAIAIVALHASMRHMQREIPPGVVREDLQTGTKWTLSYLRAPGSEYARRLIFVHGTPGSATAFADYLADPIEGFESISIDRPGFGETRPLEPALTLKEQATVIEPLLVEREGGWPVLVGHSLGAPIALQVAADFPQKVGGLVLLAGSVDPQLEQPYWFQGAGEFGFIPFLLPKSLRNANRETIHFRRELEKLAGELDRVSCPTIAAHAPDDSLVPYANLDYLTRALPESVLFETRSLPGHDHFLPWNAEQEVRDLIQRVGDRYTQE